MPERPRRHIRSYKIQEVIKRRQIILVQVVKEERGSKGAALTTYLSLAGRYTVLMPNTGRGGGISRKITNPQDRKRLKAIAQELEVPEGMGLIIRTAGAARTKQEIKRDFEYLLRLWENVRDLTLQSTAPSLVYEEGNLIKRSIRDLYSKDIDEIQVAGDAAFEEAQDFMRMLSPSQAKNVVKYEEPEALFSRYQIERQLNAMFSPYVTLRSGGYLVINQTEALVSIDVNSGKATREFSIEETALQTNLEAAEEVARQVKLRDLAGLIVIDFIDMEERRNNRKVENRLKDALRHDRARIQVGRISHFGLLEMSRQRLRTGVMEGSTYAVPALPGHRHRPLHRVGGAGRAARAGGPSGARFALLADGHHHRGGGALHPQQQAQLRHRHGAPLRGLHRGAGQRPHARAPTSPSRSRPPRWPRREPPSAPTAVNMEWAFESEEGEEAQSTDRSSSRSSRPRRRRDREPGRGEADERRSRRRRRRGRATRGAERGRAEPVRLSGNGESEPESLPSGEEEAAAARGRAPRPRPRRCAEAAPEIPGLGEQPPASLGDDERGDDRRRRRRRRGGRAAATARRATPMRCRRRRAPEPETGAPRPRLRRPRRSPALVAERVSVGDRRRAAEPETAPRSASRLTPLRTPSRWQTSVSLRRRARPSAVVEPAREAVPAVAEGAAPRGSPCRAGALRCAIQRTRRERSTETRAQGLVAAARHCRLRVRAAGRPPACGWGPCRCHLRSDRSTTA